VLALLFQVWLYGCVAMNELMKLRTFARSRRNTPPVAAQLPLMPNEVTPLELGRPADLFLVRQFGMNDSGDDRSR